MVKFKPFLSLPSFPKNLRFKIKVGVLLLCLSLFSSYQPAFSFPPLKQNLVYAQISQEQSVTPQASPVSFQLPHPGYITTPFSSFHPGIDLCSGLGMPIKPIAKGTVISTGFNFFGLGLVVEVEHEGGYKSLYAHMGKIFVTVGQVVEESDFLGEIGMTGHTSGPHTHLEISKDGKKIDPRLVLPEIRKYPNEEDFVAAKSATPSAIIAPVLTPAASESAQINIPKPATYYPAPIQPVETIQEKPAPKTDLKQQNLNNILMLTSPEPSTAPIPQGGKISLLNFNFFKFK